MTDLTPEEAKAIKALKRLAKRWPKSLWLFAGDGALNVMKVGADGGPAYREGATLASGVGVDPEYVVATITEIHSDGGDW